MTVIETVRIQMVIIQWPILYSVGIAVKVHNIEVA